MVHAQAEFGNGNTAAGHNALENLTTGKRLQGTPPSQFLLGMLQAGGLIPLLKSGKFTSENFSGPATR